MSQEHASNSQEPAVILKNDGTPFSTEAAAKAAMATKELSSIEYHVQQHQSGFAIVRNTPLTPTSAAGDVPASPESIRPPEGVVPSSDGGQYFWVIFQQKSSPNDTRDVNLSLNGNTLVIPRMEKTILPVAYKEIADHAVVDQYHQAPGESRKLIGQVMIYPYVLLGTATEAEYLELKTKGNAITREEQKRIQTEGMKK